MAKKPEMKFIVRLFYPSTSLAAYEAHPHCTGVEFTSDHTLFFIDERGAHHETNLKWELIAE